MKLLIYSQNPWWKIWGTQLIYLGKAVRWKKLNQRIGEKCFIVGSDLYRKHSSILEFGVADKLSSVVALGVDQANTITGLSQMAKTVAG